MKISAVIITLNEELNIERCLESLKWVDEVVIYDSGSTDRTLDIVQNKTQFSNVVLVQGPWLGFGPTKKAATEKAQYDWILSIDADEEVSKALADEIQQLLTLENEAKKDDLEKTLFQVSRLSYFMHRWIKHGGWFPDLQSKLFNRKYFQWNTATIHEKIEPLPSLTDEVKKQLYINQLENSLHHYVFRDISHQVSTNNRYSSLQAEDLYSKKRRYSYVNIFFKPYFKFLECYFFKLGFLDGWAGYVIARNAAYSMFLKMVKLKELYDEKK